MRTQMAREEVEAQLADEMSPSLRQLGLSDFGGRARSPVTGSPAHQLASSSRHWSLPRGVSLPKHFVTCTVGRKRSLAMFHLQNSDHVAEVLRAFCASSPAPPAGNPAGSP